MAFIDRFFIMMVEKGASDLHINSNNVPMWRLHGDILRLEDEGLITKDMANDILHEIMPDENKKEFEDKHDTDFAYELAGFGRFRANIFMDRNGIGGVFRLIPDKILTVEELNLPQAVLDMCMLTKGLVVVTGPTGSGKSTTLASMIDYVNRNRSEHIITIEDPIEFVHRNKKCLINQREVKTHTEGFKTALRAALREDPDIVLVGELRDLETIEIAIETAETGHLVFGTLHTNTAASTVERMIQQFPESKQAQIRQMLAGSLKGVVAQTLLKKSDNSGRVAALEILVGNQALSAQIRDGKTHQIQSTMQVGGKDGMVLLNDSLVRLVKEGVVTEEEALKKSVDKVELKDKFIQNNFAKDEEIIQPPPRGFARGFGR